MPLLPEASRERRYLLSLLAGALIIPSLFLWKPEYQHLEADILAVSLKPVLAILTENYQDQSPLYFVLEHFWTSLFGVREFNVRMLSVVLSVCSVFFCYRFSKHLFGYRVGLASAALLTIMPIFFQHARTARMYSLVIAAASASAYFATRYVDEHRIRDLVGWSVACVVAVYTHLFGFGTSGLTGIYMVLVLGRQGWRRLRPLLVSCVLIGLVSIWEIVRATTAFKKAFDGGGGFSLKQEFPQFFFIIHREVFAGGVSFSQFGGWGIVLNTGLLLGILILTGIGMSRAKPRHAMMGGIYLFVSQAALFAVASRADLRARYFSFLSPVYMPFFTAGLSSLLDRRGSRWRRYSGIVLTVGVVVLFCTASVGTQLRMDPGYVRALEYIHEIYQPGDLVVATPPYHYPAIQLRTSLPVLPAIDWTVLRDNIGDARRVILVVLGREPQRMSEWIKARGELIETQNFGRVRVVVYGMGLKTNPQRDQLQARMEIRAPGSRQFLLGGTVAGAARPLSTSGSSGSFLGEVDIPFLASYEPGGNAKNRVQAARDVGVDCLVLVGGAKIPQKDQLEGVNLVNGPARDEVAGEPRELDDVPGLKLVPIDLSGMGRLHSGSESLPEAAIETLSRSDPGVKVVALVRWPGHGDRNLSDSVRRLAEALAEAGADVVLGAGTMVVGPVWRKNGALLVPWPGKLLRAPWRNTPAPDSPDGLLVFVEVSLGGDLDASVIPVACTDIGLSPLSLLWREYGNDRTSQVSDTTFDFLAALPHATARAVDGTGGRSGTSADNRQDARSGGAAVSMASGLERSDGFFRQGIEVKSESSNVAVTFPDAMLDEELRGFFGVPDDSYSKSGEAGKNWKRPKVTLTPSVDGVSLGALVGAREAGWQHFRLDTRDWAKRTLPVTFIIDSNQAHLPVMFSARSIRPEPVKKIDGSRSPQATVQREDLLFLERIKDSEDRNKALETPRPGSIGTSSDTLPLYKLPVGDVPDVDFPGILATSTVDVAASADDRQRPLIPAGPGWGYRLWENLDSAVVDFRPYSGGREICTAWSDHIIYLPREEYGPNGEGQLRGRWRCGQDSWNTVARTRQKSGGILRDALWIHPRDNGTVRVCFPSVPLGSRLEGYYGLSDLANTKRTYPVYFDLLLGGEVVMRVTVPDKKTGWHEFSLDTSAWKTERADLCIEVETAKQRWRHFLFDAMAMD